MKEYEVTLEKYDYVFAKSTITEIDTFKCNSEAEARDLAYYKFGDLINILSVKVD